MRKSLAALSVLLFAAAAPSVASAQSFEELNANSIAFVKSGFINLMLPGPVVAHIEASSQPAPKKAKRAKKRGKRSAKKKM